MFELFNSTLLLLFVYDSGPLYYETTYRKGLIEPWNAFSSLLYLIPVFIFIFKYYSNNKHNYFLFFFANPLLFIGSIGSFLYHGYRSSNFFMWLDVVPILLLTMSMGFWFLYKTYSKIIIPIIVLISFLILRFLSFHLFELQTAINFSYFITGCYMLIPAYLFLSKNNFSELKLLIICAILFILALFFRFFDDYEYQIHIAGTHWLWHLFSASGAYFLGRFIILTKRLTQ